MARKLKEIVDKDANCTSSRRTSKRNVKNNDGPSKLTPKAKVGKSSKQTIKKSPLIEDLAQKIKDSSSDSISSAENVTVVAKVKKQSRRKNDVQKHVMTNDDNANEKISENKLETGKSMPAQKGKRKTKSVKSESELTNQKNKKDLNENSSTINVEESGDAKRSSGNETSDNVTSSLKKAKKNEAKINSVKETTKKVKNSKTERKKKVLPKKVKHNIDTVAILTDTTKTIDSTKSEFNKISKDEDTSSDSDFEEVDEKPNVSVLETNQHKRKSSAESEIEGTEKNKKRQKTEIKTSKEKKPLKTKAQKVKSKKDNSSSTKIKQNISITDETDVTSILLKMEGAAGPSTSKTREDNSSMNSSLDSESEEDSDWEEVADHQHSPMKSQIPANPVEITIDHPDFLKKRKRKKFDWKAWVEKKIRKFQKDVRISMHKVELLCLLAHGMQQNRICELPSLKGQALSIIPHRLLTRNISMVDKAEVLDLIKWFKSVIVYKPSDIQSKETSIITYNQLTDQFEKKEATTEKQFVLMLLIVLRVLGFNVRFVMSFQPIPLKESGHKNIKKSPRKKKIKKSDAQENIDDSKPEKPSTKTTSKKQNSKDNKKQKSKNKKQNVKDIDVKSENTGRKRRASNKTKSYKESGSESDANDDGFDPGNESYSSGEDGYERKRQLKAKRKAELKGESITSNEDSDSSDFEEDKLLRTPGLRRSKELKKNSKILSSDSSDQNDSNKGCDIWLEIYLQEENQWICVDCLQEIINKPYEIASSITQPVHYCLAYSNDGSVKDVTARYAVNWLASTRKLRVDADWWRETLETYRSHEDHNEQDDENIKEQLIKRPMPTSIAQFKNHPLYVLQRHLLKFEAIYPDTAVPVGFVRGEPVYARECVHVLHSRENWMKEGKAVKIGEEPYKMVKSRPKWKKPKENPDALDLELFGEWQTDIYMPPPAVNGKIPRNEYGNVELFKPWMLPGGTVHIQVPALNRIAKKLGVDCVAAMVGWDYHGGFSHALLDGWVVCEEHKEALMSAWEEDQAIQRQRERDKIEKRVLGNWKLLSRGLLIKDRLKTKFDLKEAIEKEKEKKKVKKTKGERANDAVLAWPRRQQEAAEEEKKNNMEHFTVETM